MSTQRTCPVCGAAANSDAGPRCEACGFSAAFVRYFSSPESAAFWRAEVARNAVTPLPLAQAALADRLFIGPNTVGICLDDACYTVDGVYGVCEQNARILQVSAGPRHTVTLMRNGTVSASGNNDFGECNVSSLRDIRQVAAASGLTYALRKDGQVQQVGTSGRQGGTGVLSLDGLSHVVRLANGGQHLAALTDDGRIVIRVADVSPGLDGFFDAQVSQLSHVKSVAAGSEYCTLALLEDGTVRFVGISGDSRSGVSDWADISSVAVDSVYAVGLSKDGHVLLAGRAPSSLLDAGRSKAAEWEDVAAVACGHSVIAAVTSGGRLLLAGTTPRREEILSVWDRDVRPAVIRAMRG